MLSHAFALTPTAAVALFQEWLLSLQIPEKHHLSRASPNGLSWGCPAFILPVASKDCMVCGVSKHQKKGLFDVRGKMFSKPVVPGDMVSKTHVTDKTAGFLASFILLLTEL